MIRDHIITIGQLRDAATADFVVVLAAGEGRNQRTGVAVKQINGTRIRAEGSAIGVGSHDVAALQHHQILREAIAAAGERAAQRQHVVADTRRFGLDHDVVEIQQQTTSVALWRTGIRLTSVHQALLA